MCKSAQSTTSMKYKSAVILEYLIIIQYLQPFASLKCVDCVYIIYVCGSVLGWRHLLALAYSVCHVSEWKGHKWRRLFCWSCEQRPRGHYHAVAFLMNSDEHGRKVDNNNSSSHFGASLYVTRFALWNLFGWQYFMLCHHTATLYKRPAAPESVYWASIWPPLVEQWER